MPDFTDAQYYLNRECTWIKFNERVLREAIVPSNPLLEQLQFIAIASSNLDEFFMIRVAGVKHLVESGVKHIDIAGMTPPEQFDAIQSMVHELVADQYRYYDGIQQKLQDHGIHFIGVDDLNEDQHMWLDEFFGREIYPVVTPMAVDSSHPFPFLSSLNLDLAVLLRRKHGDPSVKTAILPVPSSVIDRIIEVPQSVSPVGEQAEGHQFLFLEDIIAAYADRFFLGCDILEVAPFRITRDADLAIDDDVEDLLVEVEKSLKKRRKGAAVRLELAASSSRMIRELLRDELQLEERDIYYIPGPLDCKVFFSFLNTNLRFYWINITILFPILCSPFSFVMIVILASHKRDKGKYLFRTIIPVIIPPFITTKTIFHGQCIGHLIFHAIFLFCFSCSLY